MTTRLNVPDLAVPFVSSVEQCARVASVFELMDLAVQFVSSFEQCARVASVPKLVNLTPQRVCPRELCLTVCTLQEAPDTAISQMLATVALNEC